MANNFRKPDLFGYICVIYTQIECQFVINTIIYRKYYLGTAYLGGQNDRFVSRGILLKMIIYQVNVDYNIPICQYLTTIISLFEKHLFGWRSGWGTQKKQSRLRKIIFATGLDNAKREGGFSQKVSHETKCPMRQNVSGYFYVGHISCSALLPNEELDNGKGEDIIKAIYHAV